MDEQLKVQPGARTTTEKIRDLLRRPRIRVGAVVALAIAAGLISWAAVGSGDDTSQTQSAGKPTSSTSATSIGPKAVSRRGLGTLSSTLGQPIYWAGPRKSYRYEVTRTPEGRIFVRYLPTGVKAGAPGANFLIIATYPFPDAFKALKRVSGGREIELPQGGIAVVDPSYPKSVHLAFTGVDYQVEVYDPSPARSLRIAASGDVRPVR